MSTWDETRILVLAELSLEGSAMNEAALAGDLDESRFRAALIATKAEECGLAAIATAARDVECVLGRPGTEPAGAYGESMLRLATVISQDPGFVPL
ncbi:hypothetical protein [Luteibacter sahnii]|uniref:hypothetical protein n=1 Tax=Luteibacter sahnii TaxID=3021977 RepID=UPI002A6AE5C7|nr:hypothetical protein [Luteibacter sp. PPL193]MDY1549572.1 hypothetical protein [Luteibacter sp. PPL193]